MTVIAYTRIIEALNNNGATIKNAGAGAITATCPAHDDRSPSLSVTDGETRVLMYCHALCPTVDVLGALGLDMGDLYDHDTVDYTYPDGRVKRRNTREKTFSQPGKNSGRALYRAERLASADTVYLCEGEEDVHAAEILGAVAACTPSTSGADKYDYTPLHGKRVIVVQDKDAPGRKHGLLQVSILADQADVSLVEPAHGKDLSDHVAAGGTMVDLVPIRTKPRHLRITKGSNVVTKRVDWIIRDWMPAGSLVLLAGREGLGKSTIAASICAQVTTGTTDGKLAGTPRTVLYVHTEDAREFTVAPRLRAAGADMDRVLFVDVQTDTTDDGTLILPLDTAALEKVIADHDVAMVVLDAATSSMSSELSGKDDRAVRQYLEPLSQMAGRRDCVVFGICHFGKRDGADTGKLILGSIAWSQVARSVLSVAQDEESGHLIVTNTKGNLAPRVRSMEASIESTTIAAEDGDAEIGVLRWHGESTRDARDLLSGPDDNEDQEERDEIGAVVLDYLRGQGGSAHAADVLKVTRKAGLNDTAVKKARRKLGVRTERQGFGAAGAWVWTIDSPIGSIDSHSREKESMESMGSERESMGRISNATQSAQRPLMHEPTEPTGVDPQRHREPIEPETQSAHARVSEPTGRSNVISISRTAELPTRDCAICAKPLPESSRGRVHIDCALDKAAKVGGRGDAS